MGVVVSSFFGKEIFMFNFFKKRVQTLYPKNNCQVILQKEKEEEEKEKEKKKEEEKEKKEDTIVVFVRLRDNPDKKFIANLKVGDYVCLIDHEGGTECATVKEKTERVVTVEFFGDLGFTYSKPLHYSFNSEGVVVDTDQRFFTVAIVIAQPKYWKHAYKLGL